MDLRTRRRNTEGHLEIGGCDALELVRKFGTPLYVLDEEDIRRRCRAYRTALSAQAPSDMAAYAGKALLCMAVCRIMAEEGMALDAASGGELYTAVKAGFPAERIFFHGSNKSPAELEEALRAGIGYVVVDNEVELEVLAELAKALAVRQRILLRLTPGVEAHTHEYIRTGQQDSKFGLGIADGRARAALVRALELDALQVAGVHCHIGSQVLDVNGFSEAVKVMMEFLIAARRDFGFIAEVLNMGGGLGVVYSGADNPPAIETYVREIAGELEAACGRSGYPRPRLVLEPGRSIVGEAGVTLYTVGAVKDLPGLRCYVPVDGGMADNPRVALYQAVYTAELADRPAGRKDRVVTVAGKCCESGDILIWDVSLPNPKPGDILAVFTTGAYNYSMASNYNRLPRPAMVTCYHGRADLVVERETYQDVIRLDRIPARLRGEVEAAAGAADA